MDLLHPQYSLLNTSNTLLLTPYVTMRASGQRLSARPPTTHDDSLSQLKRICWVHGSGLSAQPQATQA